MITESKVTEIFCIADNFCKEFEVEMAKNALPSTTDTPKRKRKHMMSYAEVITILICFHFNSYRNFKHYYLGCVRIHWKHLFPQTFSYNRFVEVMLRCFVALTMFLRLACFGECTGISFVDSTCIPVIHNKRQFNMKVFKDIAAKGKSTMGWYVGFKLHLLCNEKGELINFVLTRANVDNRNEAVIDTLTDKVFGKLYADKGYISQSLFGHLWVSLTRRRLTIGSYSGAEAAALYHSLAITYHRCGVNVFDYFCDIIDRCAAWPPNTPVERYRELLPDRWNPSQK